MVLWGRVLFLKGPSPTPPPPKLFHKKGLEEVFYKCVESSVGKQLFRAHKHKKRTRDGANKVRREIRPCLRIGRPSGFAESLRRSYAQDDRGGSFMIFLTYGYYKTILLSVITEKDCKQSTKYAKLFAVEACRAAKSQGA